MSVPVDMTMPSYIIYRDSPVGAPFDPTAALAFYPPKDSDELFDAMRAKYPHLKTHSERMREATIEYLLQERADEQGSTPEQMPTPLTADASMSSPWLPSFPSMSTGSSSFSSPDMLGLTPPSFSNSPQSQPSQLSRQASVACAVAPTTTTPPALEEMTGVFSLSESAQPKQRIRRKMTEAEKADYRKRRIVKACEKCSRRKRKCVHNQPEMETMAKPSQKVEKPKAAAAQRKKPSVIPISLSPDSIPDPVPDKPQLPDDFMLGMDTFDLDMFEHSMPEMTSDELLDLNLQKPLKTQQFINAPWPWTNDPDFTLMFKNDFDEQNVFEDLQWHDGSDVQQGLFFENANAGSKSPSFTTANKKHPVGIQPQEYSWGGDNGNDNLWNDLEMQPRQRSRGGANGNGMLWEGLGTDQQAIGNPMLQRMPPQTADRGDALVASDSAGEQCSWGGETAPRKELTRNIKNPVPGHQMNIFPEADDHHIPQGDQSDGSESIPHTRASTSAYGHESIQQNRANVRNSEGTGTKDLTQSASDPRANVLTAAAIDRMLACEGRNYAANGPQVEPATQNAAIPGSRSTALQTIPRPLPVGFSANSQVTASSRANGSVYQRLETNSHNTPSLTGLAPLLPITVATKPANSRRSASPAFANGDTQQPPENSGSSYAEGSSASATSHSSRPRAHARFQANEAITAQGVTANGRVNPVVRSGEFAGDSSCDVFTEVLSDHVRRRDHFGRWRLRASLALLGCAMLLSIALLAVQNGSLPVSILLLALLTPEVSNGKSTRKILDFKLGGLLAGVDARSKQAPHWHKRIRTVARNEYQNRYASMGLRKWRTGIDWTALCG